MFNINNISAPLVHKSSLFGNFVWCANNVLDINPMYLSRSQIEITCIWYLTLNKDQHFFHIDKIWPWHTFQWPWYALEYFLGTYLHSCDWYKICVLDTHTSSETSKECTILLLCYDDFAVILRLSWPFTTLTFVHIIA